MAKRINNSELVYQIEDLIKKYNKKPEKKVKKKDIVELLHDAEIIVAARATFEESEIFGEDIEGVSLKPDIVKDGGRARLLPIFTTYDQIPRDYMENFSLVRMSASSAYSYMNECDDLNGMVINPFTEYNLELRKKKNTERQKSATKHYGRPSQPMPDVETTAMVIYNNKKYSINKTPFTIGRENANIVIPESYISKIHAIISYKDGKYRIADYDSTNGTKVNGTELRPKVYYELRDGYEIELSEKEKMLVYIN
ncbi:MAG: FHA domain-containing protein [Eubacterium sp.]